MTWTLEDSYLAYGLGKNDLQYLTISDNGDLLLNLYDNTKPLKDIIEQVATQLPKNVKSPSFTLRIPQLINIQIDRILSTFDTLMEEENYSGKFQPLYPIKVNQNKREVTTVMNASPRYGLEAGTKSELFLILKIFKEHKDRIVMCNGVKDREYILMVRKALKDGYRIYLSIESLTELKHVIKHLPREKLHLFLRLKPYVAMHGYWGKSSGRNSKFGLSVDNLLQAVELIKEHKLSDHLIGIHAHPGSQVSNMYELSKYFKFMINTYMHLRSLGFHNLRQIDFGGGLPIDYDGSLPPNNLEIYSRAMIKTVKRLLDNQNIPEPNILIEAGRAVTAASSILVIQPLDHQSIFPPFDDSDVEELLDQFTDMQYIQSIDDILTVWEKWKTVPEDINVDEIHQFEKRIGIIKSILRSKFMHLPFTHDHLKQPLVQSLISPDQLVLGNFSVFNGVCDWVMIGQYFPIFPVEDLHVQPETLIRLVDITCDSDGEISVFRTKDSEIELFTKDGYPLTSKDPLQWDGFPIGKLDSILDTYLIIPLVGAYQDIIEFDHNLIGDLPDVELRVKSGKFNIKVSQSVQTVQDLLKEVGYELVNSDNPYISKGDDE